MLPSNKIVRFEYLKLKFNDNATVTQHNLSYIFLYFTVHIFDLFNLGGPNKENNFGTKSEVKARTTRYLRKFDLLTNVFVCKLC